MASAPDLGANSAGGMYGAAVLSPALHFVPRILRRHEPVYIQAFVPAAANARSKAIMIKSNVDKYSATVLRTN